MFMAGCAIFDVFHESLASKLNVDPRMLTSYKAAMYSIGSISGGGTLFAMFSALELPYSTMVYGAIAVFVNVVAEILRIILGANDRPTHHTPSEQDEAHYCQNSCPGSTIHGAVTPLKPPSGAAIPTAPSFSMAASVSKQTIDALDLPPTRLTKPQIPEPDHKREFAEIIHKLRSPLQVVPMQVVSASEVALCAICLEEKKTIELHCTHKFCRTCLHKVSFTNNISQTCPLCRQHSELNPDVLRTRALEFRSKYRDWRRGGGEGAKGEVSHISQVPSVVVHSVVVRTTTAAEVADGAPFKSIVPDSAAAAAYPIESGVVIQVKEFCSPCTSPSKTRCSKLNIAKQRMLGERVLCTAALALTDSALEMKSKLNRYNLFIVLGLGLFTQGPYYLLVSYLLVGCAGFTMSQARLAVGVQSVVCAFCSPLWLSASRRCGVRYTVLAVFLLNALASVSSFSLRPDQPWTGVIFMALLGTCVGPALTFAYPLATIYVFELRNRDLHTVQPMLVSLVAFRNMFGITISACTSLLVFFMLENAGYSTRIVLEGNLDGDGKLFWKLLFSACSAIPLLIITGSFALLFGAKTQLHTHGKVLQRSVSVKAINKLHTTSGVVPINIGP
jgi:hypothetical protein